MPTPTLLIAQGWKAVIRVDPESRRLMIAVGHPEILTHANMVVDLQQLAKPGGVEIDIGKMMDIALGIAQERM